MTGASIALLCLTGVAQETATSATMPLDAIVQAMQIAQATVRPQASYQVIREYRLFGTKDSKANSEVVAEVNFRPPASKDYRIQSYSGSKRGQDLVRSILDHEVKAASGDNKDSSAISTENYSFSYMGEAILDGQPCYLLGLKPKQKERELISGEVWVDKHSFFVRQIEGEVAKTPSWWLKQVSRQAGIRRSRRNLGANQHGGHCRCPNCWRTHVDITPSGLSERAPGSNHSVSRRFRPSETVATKQRFANVCLICTYY